MSCALRPSPRPSAGGKRAAAGWRAARPMTIASPAFRSATATTARCWSAAMRAASRQRVIAALRSRGSVDGDGARRFKRARAAACRRRRPSRIATTPSAPRPHLPSGSLRQPADGTLVETYLVSRGLHLPPPPTLRFHAGLKHPSGGIWPAMVALVTRGADDKPLAIHRTFLARDGAGKAPVDPEKMMLGPCRGGAVRLGRAGRRAHGRRGHRDLPRRHAGDRPAGMGGALHFRAAHPRSAAELRDVIVLADGDDARRGGGA